MILLFLFLTLIIVLFYSIIGFKMFKAIRNENKPKFYRLSAIFLILVLIPGFFWKILPGSDLFWKPIENAQEKNYNLELTGFEFNYGELIHEYEAERAVNRDGYSIWIYKIDDLTAEYFKNPKEEFFNEHPRTQLRSHWEPEFWKKTPFDKKEQKFLDFADTKLDELEFELEDLLNEQGNYYSYEYSVSNLGKLKFITGNIDFYILCPTRKIIVKINHNN